MSSWHLERWCPSLDWKTTSGQLLLKTVEALKEDFPISITLFGSAPLQLGISNQLVSNDLDIFEIPLIEEKLGEAGLLVGQSEPYVEVCDELTFTVSPGWRDRAHEENVGNVKVILPHPIDILVSKVKRMSEKDFRAFETVIQTTGHPTEQELIESLRRVVDMYRPAFDEEVSTDPTTNTRLLWQRVFGKEIDVKEVIVKPALEARREHYSQTPKQNNPLKFFHLAALL